MSLRKYIIYISILLSLPAGYLQAAPDDDLPYDFRKEFRTQPGRFDEEDPENDDPDDPDYEYEDDDDEDDDYRGHRPSWKRGRREEVTRRLTSPRGRVRCGKCGEVIPDGRGELHVDHYSEDWVRRKESIEDSQEYQGAVGSPIRRKKMLSDAFNESPLRPTHASCNCKRTGRTPKDRQHQEVARAQAAARAPGAAAAAQGAAAAILKDETRRRLGFGDR